MPRESGKDKTDLRDKHERTRKDVLLLNKLSCGKAPDTAIVVGLKYPGAFRPRNVSMEQVKLRPELPSWMKPLYWPLDSHFLGSDPNSLPHC